MVWIGVHELQPQVVRVQLPGSPTPDPHPEGLVHREVETRARSTMKTRSAPTKKIAPPEGRAWLDTPPRPDGGRAYPPLLGLAELVVLVEQHPIEVLVRAVPQTPSQGEEES